jgi:hypothetical protein
MMQSLKGNRTRAAMSLLAVGLVLALTAVLGFFRSPLRSLVTFRQVDDYPLYVMHVYGDYGLDDPLDGGTQAAGHWQPLKAEWPRPWACTVFAVLNPESDLLLGRNFDWFNRPSLLLFTHPPAGYASVSMVDISYLGFGTEKPSWSDRLRLLDAPYLPFDGMNEAGLAVGMMAVPQTQVTDDPQKTTIDSLYAIRLILDHAASVDEALSLLDGYNIDWGGGPPLHYLVADSAGNSAVIEFVDGERLVLRNEGPWQVATNFVISGTSPAEARSLCRRYRRASEVLEQAKGHLPPDQAMSLLQDVSQEMTMWSVVYDVTSGEIAVAMGRDYEHAHHLRLRME